MGDLRDKLQLAVDKILSVIDDLDNAPKDDDVVTLLKGCRGLDEVYKEFCADNDGICGLEKGETYKNGISLEFYIEADDWHRISLALRSITNVE